MGLELVPGPAARVDFPTVSGPFNSRCTFGVYPMTTDIESVGKSAVDLLRTLKVNEVTVSVMRQGVRVLATATWVNDTDVDLYIDQAPIEDE